LRRRLLPRWLGAGCCPRPLGRSRGVPCRARAAGVGGTGILLLPGGARLGPLHVRVGLVIVGLVRAGLVGVGLVGFVAEVGGEPVVEALTVVVAHWGWSVRAGARLSSRARPRSARPMAARYGYP